MTEREREYAAKIDRIAAGIDDWAKKNAATPESAGAVLLEAGIITEDGELAPEYGGPKRRRREDKGS